MDVREFLQTVFGSAEGFLFLSTKYAPEDKEITNHKPFRYPDNLEQAVTYASMREDEDLYFSPMLYQVPRRRAASVAVTPVVYADTDTFPVQDFLIPPSINVETSPGRHASYWLLDGDYDREDVEAVSRIIALTHSSTVDGKQAGVDPGGWDLSQLLRLPPSQNLKYRVQGKYEGYTEPYAVAVDEDLSPGTIYSLDEIKAAYDPANLPPMPERASMDMPDEDALPAAKDVLRRITSSRTLSDLYGKEPRGDQDWSDTMYRFISEMLRAGFTPEEVLVGAWHAACNKYKRDDRPMGDLWDYDIRKALADPRNRPSIGRTDEVSYDEPKDAGISTEIEVALLDAEQMPTTTFVDRYVKWAASKTDAPAPYHQASAMTVLSCVLGEWGVGYPQFGQLRLGLNFVIMGETTDTRKTTSRNLMKQLLRSIQDPDNDQEYILTSDATGESLLDTLADRAHKSSLYDRDEAQQLVEDIKGGKGYLKGMFETFNELYDGWAHGRLRMGKKTKDTPVNFVQYLMGIRSQIQDNLELKDFVSGWGPRNIYVRGESPARTRENSRLKQGDLDDSGYDGELIALGDELREMRNFWSGKSHDDRAHPTTVMFDDDAWTLITDLEWDLKDYFKDHARYEVLKPCIERMTINAMKVAILFAMSARRDSVSLQDVINVRAYASHWMEDLLIVVEGVTESLFLRDVRALEGFIAEKGGQVTYGTALKWGLMMGKDRREFSDLVDTLVEQDTALMVEDPSGRRSLKLL